MTSRAMKLSAKENKEIDEERRCCPEQKGNMLKLKEMAEQMRQKDKSLDWEIKRLKAKKKTQEKV